MTVDPDLFKRGTDADPNLSRQAATPSEAQQRLDHINKMKGQAPPEQAPIIERNIAGIDPANPTPGDLQKLRGLSQALGKQAQGRSEGEGADAEGDAANAQLGADIAQPVATVGRTAAGTLEKRFVPGSGGVITGAVFGAADTMDFSQSPDQLVSNALKGAASGAKDEVKGNLINKIPGAGLVQDIIETGTVAATGSGEDLTKHLANKALGRVASKGFDTRLKGSPPPVAPGNDSGQSASSASKNINDAGAGRRPVRKPENFHDQNIVSATEATNTPPRPDVSISRIFEPGRARRNEHLAGQNHPDTGIPYDRDGYPDFSSVKKGPDVKIMMTGNRTTDEKVANMLAGYDRTPSGYTWHHHQNGNTMQLVPADIHGKTGHDGGHSGR
jgi:hypothetical protein